MNEHDQLVAFQNELLNVFLSEEHLRDQLELKRLDKIRLKQAIRALQAKLNPAPEAKAP
jgi:hypothetical protein